MTWWAGLWFWVLTAVSVAFAFMAVVVTVFGALDIVKLFGSLRARHDAPPPRE
jgi:hypothetical protein